jgi:hypothetical protein
MRLARFSARDSEKLRMIGVQGRVPEFNAAALPAQRPRKAPCS